MSKSGSSLGNFFKELRRRKVFQVAVVYAVVGWVLIQVADTIVPLLHLPHWTPTFILVIIIIGFPIALIVAWAFELTPEGVKSTEAMEGKKAEKPPAAKPQPSIVVLPFDDISPGKENEYFSDGLTEEIITDLSYVHQLRVISRNSAMTFKGSKKNTRTIAQELDVQYVLEGSVRKVANDLRITAQLIDATSDAHLWAERYSGTLDDVFAIQEKVSRSIVDALKMKLSPEDKKKIAERPIENVQAYECYLRARQEMWRWTEEGLNRALQSLQNALEIIGENAILYAGMGLVHCFYYELGIRQDEVTLKKVEEFANKIMKLEPDSLYGHNLLGRIERFRGNSKKAIINLKRAYTIDPVDPDTMMWLGYLYATFAGKPNAAEPLVKKLIEIDPLTPITYFLSGMFHCMKGQFDLAIKSMRKWIQMDPENNVAKYFFAHLLAWNKQFDEAYILFDQIVKGESPDVVAGLSLFSKYALQGEKAKALQSLTEEVKSWCWNDPEGSWFMADYYALINEKEQALDWFERAIYMGWFNYPLLNEQDPFLENIRGEKRFKKLMERVKYEWEHFEV